MLLFLAACAGIGPSGGESDESRNRPDDTAGDTERAVDTAVETGRDSAADTGRDTAGETAVDTAVDTGSDADVDTAAPTSSGAARATVNGGVASGGAGGVSTLAAVDLDGDGDLDIVVGAPGAADGTAGVFDPAAAAGEVQLTAVTRATVQGRNVGWLVPHGGDGDGDGVDDLVIGRGEGLSTDRAAPGAVYLLSGAGLGPASTLLDAHAEANGEYDNGFLRFGSHGDIDGDGFPDLAVGATLDNDGNWEWTDSGSVALWMGPRAGALWYVDADAHVYGTWFEFGLGASLLLADLDADGYADLLVGAPQWEEDVGAVLTLPGGATGEWDHRASEAATSIVRGVDAGMRLGADAFCRPGDLDGDGRLDLVLTSSTAGMAWAWSGWPGTGENTVGDAAVTVTGDAGSFGTAAACNADLDGDGVHDLAVGDPGGDAAAADAGTLWAFIDPLAGADAIGTGASDAAWHGEAAGDAFASAVVAADGELVVGAPGRDAGAPEAGAVYLGAFAW
jgi:hypothetical protein